MSHTSSIAGADAYLSMNSAQRSALLTVANVLADQDRERPSLAPVIGGEREAVHA